ncbi:hypothetical protein TCAL_08917 [Tigriopus californicus]|uniref:Major facilitator superfamily (MFS) profile domain-containing protein n=1 Tax=Tigriopus californicus TaxID=6832 RepID=A0A553P028_TIGCA|nr:MFS-type transporter SLC18B1-like [Tigriopus californicus]TRY71035.1 hypothetical protein TCAL_08917 [Tigriopus californicus]|eukprot:TCALIF_08917-PA protein Name:"Similar to Slc18b1 MFS-type transporter SLC18B1 (Mus musculus)" AED:0.09 eAED:0.09 QI:111/1/1/1/0.87/0.88/9/95/581
MPDSETTPLLHKSNEEASRVRLSPDSDSSIPRVLNSEVDAADVEEYHGSEGTDGTVVTEDYSSSNVPEESSPAITTRQYLIVTVLLIATLTSSFAVCLFPPFFPKIAEEKGCSATAYGFIIGTNCLTSFIVTPFIGKNLRIIGLRFALIVGMFTGGVCCFLSGFLEFFSPDWSFVALAVLIRVIHATGNALVITATFTYSSIEFSNSVGQIFSLTRTAMNLAQLFGPSIGGLIYGFGGFYVPFVFMGSVQIIMSLVSIPLLPQCRSSSPQMRAYRFNRPVTIPNMLSIPLIWFSFISFIAATACNGFLSINLEPQVLRTFDLSPFYVGLLFGLKDGANSIASPIWGYLCDKSRHSSVKPYIVLSALTTGASFFLLGGSNVIGIHLGLKLPLVITALSLNGVGIGGEQVAGIVDALNEASNAGYPNDPSMHGLIAGLWSSLSGAGRFVSRAGSGFLVDHFGFDQTAALATGLQGLLAGVTLAYVLLCECRVQIRGSARKRSTRWESSGSEDESDENGDENPPVFRSNNPTQGHSSRSVQIDIPPNRRHRRPRAYTQPKRPHSHRERRHSTPSYGDYLAASID